MYYEGKNYNLEDYFKLRLEEDGFADEATEKVNGYYRDEAEYNIIADYISSCGLEKDDDIAFVKSKGYMPGDFIEGED